jgi:hypothetical protein
MSVVGNVPKKLLGNSSLSSVKPRQATRNALILTRLPRKKWSSPFVAPNVRPKPLPENFISLDLI